MPQWAFARSCTRIMPHGATASQSALSTRGPAAVAQKAPGVCVMRPQGAWPRVDPEADLKTGSVKGKEKTHTQITVKWGKPPRGGTKSLCTVLEGWISHARWGRSRETSWRLEVAFGISPGESDGISVTKRQRWRWGRQWGRHSKEGETLPHWHRAGSGMRVESPFSVAEK